MKELRTQEERKIQIRPIQKEDNEALAAVIRATLTEFGAAKPGTVYFDPTTDHLYELFQSEPRSLYLVAEGEGTLLGGSGIYPTAGLPADTCELVKIYLLPGARGTGLGKSLLLRCLEAARQAGFKKVYLETLPELHLALSLYERLGFQHLDGPLGESGHFGCDRWMLLHLD